MPFLSGKVENRIQSSMDLQFSSQGRKRNLFFILHLLQWFQWVQSLTSHFNIDHFHFVLHCEISITNTEETQIKKYVCYTAALTPTKISCTPTKILFKHLHNASIFAYFEGISFLCCRSPENNNCRFKFTRGENNSIEIFLPK